jgi:hydroxymethylpyrimidine pyrophosphatase-like HAD family hydrolase
MSTHKVIFVDMDGTLCTEERTFERPLATALPGAREALQRFHDAGHTIVIWTARGWEQYRVTKHWLDTNGFVYHQIMMGKPIASVFIDDRAKAFQGWDKEYVS